MLPSNPRAGRSHIPPTQPRSRSVGPSKQGPRYDSAHDIGTHSRPPSPAHQIRHARLNVSRDEPNDSSYRRSDDSYSSSASSILNRTRDRTGYTSSRTSIDDIDTPSKHLIDSRSWGENRTQTPQSYRSGTYFLFSSNHFIVTERNVQMKTSKLNPGLVKEQMGPHFGIGCPMWLIL